MITADIRELVSHYHSQATLVGFHCEDQKAKRFFAGYVEEIEADRFLVRYVNTSGLPGEGDVLTAWFYFDEIRWMNSTTPYLVGLEKLYQVHERFAHLKTARWKRSPRSIVKSLGSCLKDGQACRVWLSDDDKAYAIVKAIDQKFVLLTLIGEDGRQEGELLVRLQVVLGVRVGGIDEVTMTYLATMS